MSYTIPESADTQAQAILAVASAIADEDKTALGDGSVNKALDVLGDVLAGEDIQVPQTNAGAILALAQYATGGGGGGAQTTDFYFWNVSDVDEVNQMLPASIGYVTGLAPDAPPTIAELDFVPISETVTAYGEEVTFYGIKLLNVPCGAPLYFTMEDPGWTAFDVYTGYAPVTVPSFLFDGTFVPLVNANGTSLDGANPYPIDGFYNVGVYNLTYTG